MAAVRGANRIPRVILIVRAFAATVLVTVTALPGHAAATAAGVPRQQSFATPEQAVEALVTANRAGDIEQLLSILGPAAAPLIRSDDPVADRSARSRFVQAYERAHRIEQRGARKAVLVVGPDAWPLPIPIVRDERGWRFDTAAGEQEVLDRRIGADELTAIGVCRAYVQAQRDYAQGRIASGQPAEFAQHLMSRAGTHDGLYWAPAPGAPESPLGPLVAQALASGYEADARHGGHRPYFGYYFHVLTAQGPHASRGERSYVVGGRMTRGFALIAYPAQYGVSGVMTFIVNQTGIVFEKNLGPTTGEAAQAISRYDPDSSWGIVTATSH